MMKQKTEWFLDTVCQASTTAVFFFYVTVSNLSETD